MSIHKSLATAGNLRRHRNVLTRSERLDLLKKEGRWKDGESIFNLPKVRNIMAKAKKKEKEADAAAAPAAGAALAGAPGAAAPAAGKGAAPAAAAKGAAPAAAKGAAPAKKEEKKK
ncbi:MAG TPA: small basic protein [Planctomycetota bacterium]|jgi:small basic protein (TIGR04137 family)|nr:small basic protein [Planctomycetota bacterium]